MSMAITEDMIDVIIAETDTGEKFQGANIVAVRHADGKYLDLLFDSAGEPYPLESNNTKAVADFYQIEFSNLK